MPFSDLLASLSLRSSRIGRRLSSGTCIEPLESRIAPASVSLHADLTGGTLTVSDISAGQDDHLTFKFINGGANLEISDTTNIWDGVPTTGVLSNGGMTLTIATSAYTGGLIINTAGGNDTVTLDFSGGNFIHAGGVDFNGGNPTVAPGDKLNILGGSQGLVTYNHTNANDGSIVMSNFGTVRYTGLESGVSNSGIATDVIFNLPATTNSVTLGDDGTVGNGLSRLGAASIEVTDFSNPSGTLTINRGNAADTLTVNALPDFNASLKIGSAANPFNAVNFAGAVALGPGKSLSADATGSLNLASGASLATSGAGAVTLTTGGTLFLNSGSSIAVVDGNLTLNANVTGTGAANLYGIACVSASLSSSGSGNISLTGHGQNAASSSHYGIALQGATITSTGTGSITLVGVGGSGTDSGYGVVLLSSSQITSSVGAISITGTGGDTVGAASSTNTLNIGVTMRTGARVVGTGSAPVTIMGTGGLGAGVNVGLDMEDAGTLVSAVNGNIQITAAANAATTGYGNIGLNLITGAKITSTGTGPAAGTINITGTGGGGTTENYGVDVEGVAGFITTVDGAIQITGTAGAGGVANLSYGVTIGYPGNAAGESVLVTGTANVGITSDSVRIVTASASINAGANTVTIKPKTAGTPTTLGSDDVNGVLGLTTAELSQITAGSLQIGDTNSGAITMSADLTIGSHLALVSGAGISGSGKITLAAGKNLSLSANGAINLTGALTVPGTTTLGAGAANNISLINASNAFATVITTSGATVSLRDDGGFDLGATNSSTLLSVESAGTITQSGVLSGTGGLTKRGVGTLILSLANGFGGNTTLSAGTVQFSKSGAFGAGTITLNDAATGSNNTSLLATVVMNDTAFSQGAGQANFNKNIVVANFGSGTATVGTTPFSGSVPSGFNATVFTGALTLNKATTLQSGNSDRTSFLGAIGGTVGTLTVNGGRRVTLDPTVGNTFIGDVVIAGAGTALQLGSGDAIPDASNVDVGASSILYLAKASGSESINALTGSGTVQSIIGTAQGLTVGTNGGSGTFSGVIQDGSAILSLTKAGAGTQTLSTSNSYSGLTTVSVGVLKIQNASALGGAGTGTTVVSGAALQIDGSFTVAEPLNLSGTGIASAGALVNLSGSDTLTGGITLAAATTIGVAGGTLTTGTINGAFGLSLDISLGATAKLSSAIGATSAPTSFSATGAGTLQLGTTVNVGGNTTNISTPTVLIANSMITDTGAINFNSGGTIDGAFTLTLSAGTGISFASAIGSITPLTGLAPTVTAGGITFGHGVTLAANGNLTANASGTIILSSASSDLATSGTGAISLNAGLYVVAVSGASIAVVNGGLTLTGNSAGTGIGNFSGVSTVGGSTLSSTGSGNITLTGFGGDDATTSFHSGLDLRGAISSTGTGTITLSGTGGLGNGSDAGVRIAGSAQISSVSGAILITGVADGGSTGNFQDGVDFQGGSVNSSGSASITLVGTGGSGTNNDGVVMSNGAQIVSTGSGNVQLTGTAGAGGIGTSSYGLSFFSASSGTAIVTSAGTGSLTAVADSILISPGTGTVDLNAGANTVTIRQKTNGLQINLGAVDVTGSLLGLTDTELDLITAGTLQIGDANSGAITISAAISHGNNLSLITGAGVTINQSVTMALNKSFTVAALGTTTGTISLATSSADLAASGTGSISLTTVRSISMASGASILVANGDLLLSANQQSTPTTGAFAGISILNGATVTTSGTGNISLLGRTGTTSFSAFDDDGVTVQGLVQSTGAAASSGKILITGVANTGGADDNAEGVTLTFGGVVQSVGGDISITGTGSLGSGLNNRGVLTLNGVARATGLGNVAITGTARAGTATGIWINSVGDGFSTNFGTLTLTATGSNDRAIFANSGTALTSAAANVTLTADGMDLLGSISAASAGSVTLLQKSVGTPINLGGTDLFGGTPTLGLSDAELDVISAGTIVIGDANSGAVTISQVISPASYQTLDVEHAASFAATGGVALDVTSATVFEKMIVNGALSIDPAATLTVTALGGFVPASNDRFTLINNPSGAATTGSFSGKPGGTTVPLGGVDKYLIYSGGGGVGNDVVLTDTAISVSLDAPSVDEGSSTGLVYSFTRGGDNSTPLVVNFTHGGSVVAADYTASSSANIFDFSAGTLTIPAGASSVTVTLVPLDDQLVEGSETATLTVALNGNYGITGLSATGTILDNDTATIGFSTLTSSITEGTDNDMLDVVLTLHASGTGTPALAHDVTFNVIANGGSATDGTDYNLPLPLTFSAGAHSGDVQTANLSITNDFVAEDIETANLGLFITNDGSLSQVTIATDASANHVTSITDNDIDLTLTVVANADPVVAGSGVGNLSYTFTVINHGFIDATRISIHEFSTLPDGVSFSSGVASAGTFNGGDWILPLAKSGTATLTVNFTADHSVANGAIANDAASVVASEQTVVNTGDDSAGANATIIRHSDLGISIADAPDPVGPNQQLTYTITVTNNGPSDSTSAHFTDSFPAGLSAITWTADFSNNGGPGTASGDGDIDENLSVPFGGSVIYTVHATPGIGLAWTTISNTGTLSSSEETNSLNDHATEPTLIAGVDLHLTSSDGVESVTPNNIITYVLTYNNGGFVTAAGVKISDVVPANTVFDAEHSTLGWSGVVDGSVAGTAAIFNIGGVTTSAEPGEVKFAVRVLPHVSAGAESIVHSATISDDQNSGADRDSSDNTATDTNVLVAAPDLVLSVQADHAVIVRGQTLHYTYAYLNAGNQDASEVTIVATVPVGTHFNSNQSTHGVKNWSQVSPDTYQFDIGSLPAGAFPDSVIFAVDVDQLRVPGLKEIDNSASIGDGGINGPDPTPANNIATTAVTLHEGIYAVSNSNGGGIYGPGSLPVIRVFDVTTGVEAPKILAYEKSYRDGVRIAVGDLNGDGFEDIVTATRSGSGRIRVFDGLTHQRLQIGELTQLNAFSGLQAHGAYVALGDVDGDNHLDIIASSGLGGGTVKVFSGVNGSLLQSDTPFGADYKGGVRVASGDLNGDGLADVITGQGSYGSKVKVSFSGQQVPAPVRFSAGAAKLRDGVFLAAGDTTGDGIAEIIVGRGKEGSDSHASIGIFSVGKDSRVRTTSGPLSATEIKTIPISNTTYRLGARVSAADINFDGIADIIVGAGPLGGSKVQIFNGDDGTQISSFRAFSGTPNLGVFTAAGAPPVRFDT